MYTYTYTYILSERAGAHALHAGSPGFKPGTTSVLLTQSKIKQPFDFLFYIDIFEETVLY